jgi:hypothetical protein
MKAIAEPHPFVLQLFGKARPRAQLDEARIGDLQATEQMPIGPQPVGRNVRVASVVLGTGNTEAVAQAVELLGIDGVDGEAPIQQSIDDGPVRNLDGDGDDVCVACDREDPIAQIRQTSAAVRELALSGNPALCIENAALGVCQEFRAGAVVITPR